MKLRLLAPVVTLLAGCAYRTPDVQVPEAVAPPGARIEATDVAVVDRTRAIDEATVKRLHDDARDLLESSRGARSGAAPTVLHVHVTLEDRESYVDRALAKDGMAIFGLWPVLFGMKNGQQRISVDVEAEREGHRVFGHGEAEEEGSVYARAERRALAVALGKALAGVR